MCEGKEVYFDRKVKNTEVGPMAIKAVLAKESIDIFRVATVNKFSLHSLRREGFRFKEK